MCLVSENGTNYIPRHAIVHNPVPVLDQFLKIALAAANFVSFEIVRTLVDNVTTSLVTEPVFSKDTRKRLALSVWYDSELLNTLAPRARVEIGSLIGMFPSTHWQMDGGGQVINWGSELDGLQSPYIPVVSPPIPALLPRPPPSPTVHVHLGIVPDVFTVGVTRYSKRVVSVDGVNLKDGDVVRDADGIHWYFKNGVLSDRIRITVESKNIKVARGDTGGRGPPGDAIGPRLKGSSPPDNYTPDSKVELEIVWSPDDPADSRDSSTFAAKSLPAGGAAGFTWGWWIELQTPSVEHPLGLCQGKHGIAIDRATPQLCIRAGGTWDRPCERDSECPFYDWRRGRGGCNRSGFCEMPLGVDNKSFRLAGNPSHMMHHGCSSSDPDFPWCTSSSSDVRFTRSPP